MENANLTDESVDLKLVARHVELAESQVAAAAQLLLGGNTIPFITRYRKDETGGLDEQKLQEIRQEMARLTALNERKSIILKSVENQGKLTPDLRQKIEQTTQARNLEDLYLPFKPKKQSRATAARQQGLEPLARDLRESRIPESEWPTRASEFVRVDRGLNSVDEVFEGVRHLLAERFSEHLKLRRALRKLFWESATLETRLIPLATESEGPGSEPVAPAGSGGSPAVAGAEPDSLTAEETVGADQANTTSTLTTADPEEATDAASRAGTDSTTAVTESGDNLTLAESGTGPTADPDAQGAGDDVTPRQLPAGPATETGPATTPAPGGDTAESVTPTEKPAAEPSDPAAAPGQPTRKKKKKKKRKSRPDPFAEYAGFSQAVQKIPPHRILAIGRGERSGRLKVRIVVDEEKSRELARSFLVPADHPGAEFLNQAAEDALQRLILPAVEREIRRDLVERAENHAVQVFARNLRSLILQPPVRGQRIMGIDPGYRSGCKVAVIDETGQPIGHGVFSIVGNDERKTRNRQRLVELIDQHRPDLIAIGNGSGCHAVEQFISDLLRDEMAERKLRFTIINQAGTSSYSTSETAREELPEHDPLVRSAISIARRLQDPLSELVKVPPANIGVGLYQHDVRAKHLGDALNEEVGSCVNLVGVNVNTASVSLLRHVSGLGPLTARRIVEHRDSHGPFPSREALREVAGMGDVTWNQSAGFLRVDDGEQRLDRTRIHPESYATTLRFLEKIEATPDTLLASQLPAAAAPDHQPAPERGETETAPLSGAPEIPPLTSAAELAQRRAAREAALQRIRRVDPVDMAQQLEIGLLTMREILRALRNPEQDPRERLPAPIFRSSVLKLEDLKPGERLRGQVVNVVDFGVFVNVGLGDSCLVHISRLSNRFIRDPHWHYSVGDILDVWVSAVDTDKKRATLTAIPPESERQQSQGGGKRDTRKPGSGGSRRPGSGPPRGKGGGRDRGAKPGGPGGRKAPGGRKRPAKPKPVTPITEEMVEGKKPMRSFSDLLQFHQRKSSDEPGGDQDKP